MPNGADGVSHRDDIPVSLDHESAPVRPGRNPGGLTVGRDAGRARFFGRDGAGGRGPQVGRGTKRDRREAVSPGAGLAPKRHPHVHPTPTNRGPQRRRHRPTTRPNREPCLTGLSFIGDEAAVFRLATASGTNQYRDRPGLRSLAQPPGSAERGRQSPYACWVRLVFGLRGPEPRCPR